MTAQAIGALPPVAVTAGATWLLHKRAGMPLWQALVSVLLGLAFGPDGPGDQLAVFAAQATRRIAAETARRRAPQQGRWQACGAAASAVLTVSAAAITRAAAFTVPDACRLACSIPLPGSHLGARPCQVNPPGRQE